MYETNHSIITSIPKKMTPQENIAIRTMLMPGDLGYVAYLHGKIYSEECGYNLKFESYVLQGLYEFGKTYNPAKDRVWICEMHGHMVGFLLGSHQEDKIQLRFFILTPEVRGKGLGKALMDAFMQYVEDQKIETIYLWTTREQETAIALYKRYGFTLTEEVDSELFGKPLVEQRYDCKLFS